MKDAPRNSDGTALDLRGRSNKLLPLKWLATGNEVYGESELNAGNS